jgi:ornithine decarboxylase
MQKFKTVDELVNQLKPENQFIVSEKNRYILLQKLFKINFLVKFLYAVKTNPHPEVLKTIVESGIENFDVASIKEIKDIKSNKS